MGPIPPPFPPIAPYPHWRWGIPVKRGRISYNFADTEAKVAKIVSPLTGINRITVNF